MRRTFLPPLRRRRPWAGLRWRRWPAALAEAWEEIGHGHWAAAETLYELAATTSNEPALAICGAELAWSRGHGDRAVALFELGAALASACCDAASEVRAAAGATEVMNRYGSTMLEIPPPEASVALVERSEVAAQTAGDASSLARAAVARMWLTRRGADLDAINKSAVAAVKAARLGSDPAVLSSALDGQSAAALQSLRSADAVRIIDQRLRLSENFTGHSARQVLERMDALYMASDVSLLMGQFEATLIRGLQLHRLAQQRGTFYGGLTHLAPAHFFLGHFDECLDLAAGVYWELTHRGDAGASLLVRAFACAGAVYGYRGDDESAARWFARAEEVAGDPSCHWKCDFTLLMRADVHLHHGRRQEAALLLAKPPPRLSGEWQGWHGAIRAEAIRGAAVDEAEGVLEGGAYSRAVLARARGTRNSPHRFPKLRGRLPGRTYRFTDRGAPTGRGLSDLQTSWTERGRYDTGRHRQRDALTAVRHARLKRAGYPKFTRRPNRRCGPWAP